MLQSPAALPLVDDVEIRSVLALLDQRGVPSQKLLEKAHLPTVTPVDPGHFVSARSLLRFLSLAARETELDSLGWCSAADTETTHIGSWGRPVSQCRTLREAIEVFCRSYARTVTFVELGLSIERNTAWLWRRRSLPSVNPDAELQGEQFMLGAMVSVVRHFVGNDWSPAEIRMDSGSADWLQSIPELQNARLRLNHATMAIALPLQSLDPPIGRRRVTRPRSDSNNRAATDPEDFIGSLHAALEPIVSQTSLSLELGAEIAGTSSRTLRRWLHHEGTTWREVVDRTRFEKSVDLLREPARPIAEIAYEVGYSDPAHFTRAFHRWTNESPSDYRRRRLWGASDC